MGRFDDEGIREQRLQRLRIATPEYGDEGLGVPSAFVLAFNARIAASVTGSQPLPWWLFGWPTPTVRHLLSSMTPCPVHGVRSPLAGMGRPRSSVSSL